MTLEIVVTMARAGKPIARLEIVVKRRERTVSAESVEFSCEPFDVGRDVVGAAVGQAE